MINISKKDYKDISKKVGKDKMAKIEQDSNKSSTQQIVKVQAKRKDNNLEQNTAKIVELHNSIAEMLSKSLENALQIGELLFELSKRR